MRSGSLAVAGRTCTGSWRRSVGAPGSEGHQARLSMTTSQREKGSVRQLRRVSHRHLRLHSQASARFWVYWDGTGMEQRGRNRWKPLANAPAAQTAQLLAIVGYWLRPFAKK